MFIHEYIFAYDLKDGESERYTEITNYLKTHYRWEKLNKSVHLFSSEYPISEIEKNLLLKLRSGDHADLIFVDENAFENTFKLQIKRLKKSNKKYDKFCDYVLVYDIQDDNEREEVHQLLESPNEFQAKSLSESVYQFDSKMDIELIKNIIGELFTKSEDNKVFLIYGEDCDDLNLKCIRIDGTKLQSEKLT